MNSWNLAHEDGSPFFLFFFFGGGGGSSYCCHCIPSEERGHLANLMKLKKNWAECIGRAFSSVPAVFWFGFVSKFVNEKQ